MQLLDINDEFIGWAKGFSGMNGGNLYAPLWFCGIEFGGDQDIEFKIDEKYAYRNKKGEIIPCWNEDYRNDHKGKNGYKTWPYVQKCAKVACQFVKGDIRDFYDYMDSLFSKNGDTFALNLYPINFPKSSDDYWTNKHYKKTGFPNKLMYKAWCMANRFPFLRKLVNEYRPKTLICTGNNFRQDFRLAFAPTEKLFDEAFYQKEEIDKYKCEHFKINGEETLVVITPFFGQGGIMSDVGLIELAELIKRLTS